MFDSTASIAGNGGRETTLGRASIQLPDSASNTQSFTAGSTLAVSAVSAQRFSLRAQLRSWYTGFGWPLFDSEQRNQPSAVVGRG
jgi:hypothetical protein